MLSAEAKCRWKSNIVALSCTARKLYNILLFNCAIIQIASIVDGFEYTAETVERIAKQFELEMDLSLNEQFDESSLQMENTYIPELPDGTGDVTSFCFAQLHNLIFLLRRRDGKISRIRFGWHEFPCDSVGHRGWPNTPRGRQNVSHRRSAACGRGGCGDRIVRLHRWMLMRFCGWK